jgi:hypothetical protein
MLKRVGIQRMPEKNGILMRVVRILYRPMYSGKPIQSFVFYFDPVMKWHRDCKCENWGEWPDPEAAANKRAFEELFKDVDSQKDKGQTR